MKKYGVIGYPVKHSFSPEYFLKKFNRLGISDCEYAAYELADISELKKLIEKEKLDGFNVTIPHKEGIIPHLDSMSEAATKINAVNTVTVKNGKLHGDNTDHIGFSKSILGLIRTRKTSALLFGTGGSSLAVKYALRQMGVSYASVSRGDNADFRYDELTEKDIEKHQLLVNTTPLGMWPDTKASVNIPYGGISEQHLCYDLIYTPAQTRFLTKAKAQGAAIKNGLQMLEIQADEAWNIWNC